MKTLCAFAIILFSAATFADTCSSIKDEYDRAYCFTKAYPQIDTELNKSYEQLTSLLSKPQKKTLTKIQLNWMEQRNTACSLKSGDRFYVDMKCVTDTTNSQNEFLKNQIAACKSGTCGVSDDNEKPETIPKSKYKATYYQGKKFVASEVVDAISINYPYNQFKNIPSDSFHATWETDIDAEEDKTLILSVSVSWSDVSVFIDDDLLTNWNNNSKELPIKLSKGTHRIKVEYFNHWHTVNFNASFSNYPKLNIAAATQRVSPLLNSDTKTLYIGAYESKNIYNETLVKINKSKKPIILFLASYEAINWKIENPHNVSIKAIFFNSYDPGSSIIINNNKTSIFKLQELPYAYERFEAPSAIIQKVTGIIPSYTYGEYGLSQVEVPDL
jgi:uncharacterized protein YecT (DUF1311 family)